MLNSMNNDGALALILVILGLEPNEVVQWNTARKELDFVYQYKPGGPMPPLYRDDRRTRNPYKCFGKMQGL